MRLNGKLINVGDLRTAVTIQRRVLTTDAGGYQVESWVTVASVWSRWINDHGDEVVTAAAQGAESGAVVLMRWRADVDATCALLKGGVRWEIVGTPDDIRERHEWLEMRVRRMVGG